MPPKSVIKKRSAAVKKIGFAAAKKIESVFEIILREAKPDEIQISKDGSITLKYHKEF